MAKSAPTKGSTRLPVSAPVPRLTTTRMLQGLALVLAIGFISFLMMRNTSAPPPADAAGAAEVARAERQSAAQELTSISQATVNSDKTGSLVQINTAKGGVNNDEQKSLMDDIMFATKGDGNLRDVAVDGKVVDPALIKLAMFDNHDFMPRDETKLAEKPKRFDMGSVPQRSHFRKMTYPLVTSHGAVATDTGIR
jgi:hypothetical protein